MPITIHVPTPLRNFTKGQAEVTAEAKTVAELIVDLDKNFPGLKEKLCDEAGKLRRFINIYANDEDIRFLKNLDTELKDGDSVSIVPAIAGG